MNYHIFDGTDGWKEFSFAIQPQDLPGRDARVSPEAVTQVITLAVDAQTAGAPTLAMYDGRDDVYQLMPRFFDRMPAYFDVLPTGAGRTFMAGVPPGMAEQDYYALLLRVAKHTEGAPSVLVVSQAMGSGINMTVMDTGDIVPTVYNEMRHGRVPGRQ